MAPDCIWKANGQLDAWWHHVLETFSALLALCVGNLATYQHKELVMQSFDVFFIVSLNKHLNNLLLSVWRNDRQCTYIFMFSQKNTVRQGLIFLSSQAYKVIDLS